MSKRVVGVAGILGLVAAAGLSSAAMAARKPTTRAFTRTFQGANIAPNESAEKVTDSLTGSGAAVVTISVHANTTPLTQTATSTIYFANGVVRAIDTTTPTAPNSAGIGTLSGSGKCVGGTGIHRHEKCRFTVTGTYNAKTGTDSVKWTGTVTR